MQSLESATLDIGKAIRLEHLLLVANSLSATGEFVGLNVKGVSRQREHALVKTPFMQACFSVSYLISNLHLNHHRARASDECKLIQTFEDKAFCSVWGFSLPPAPRMFFFGFVNNYFLFLIRKN